MLPALADGAEFEAFLLTVLDPTGEGFADGDGDGRGRVHAAGHLMQRLGAPPVGVAPVLERPLTADAALIEVVDDPRGALFTADFPVAFPDGAHFAFSNCCSRELTKTRTKVSSSM